MRSRLAISKKLHFASTQLVAKLFLFIPIANKVQIALEKTILDKISAIILK